MHEDITGIILSGGKSARMGTNKSFLRFGDKTIIENIIDLMHSLFPNVLLITNEPDLYRNFDVEIHEDIYRFQGPLAGIHSGLTHSRTLMNFVISCDIPLITADVINFIINYYSSSPIIISKADSYIQQLCGVYNKECMFEIENIFRENNEVELRDPDQKKRKCRVLSLVERLNGTVIDIEREFVNYRADTFLNLNNPEDYQKVLSIIKLSKQ